MEFQYDSFTDTIIFLLPYRQCPGYLGGYLLWGPCCGRYPVFSCRSVSTVGYLLWGIYSVPLPWCLYYVVTAGLYRGVFTAGSLS